MIRKSVKRFSEKIMPKHGSVIQLTEVDRGVVHAGPKVWPPELRHDIEPEHVA